MKKATITGIASLITVGAIVGFSLRNANNDSKESEGIVLTASTTPQTANTTPAVKPALETEVSFEPLNTIDFVEGFTYSVDKPDIMNLTKVGFNPKFNSLELYHEFKSGEKINLTPTNIKIVDAAGNEGSNYGCANIHTSGDGLDITQKNFTVWYEFANDPEIGILRVDITLP